MNIYLAARYSRREELCGYRQELEALGFVVTSRWLNGEHQIFQGQPLGREYEQAVEDGDDSTLPLRAHFAEEDMADVLAADVVISFTERPRSGNSRGGRHVEFGIALALDKGLIVIGHRENVFHCCSHVLFAQDWKGALVWLEKYATAKQGVERVLAR